MHTKTRIWFSVLALILMVAISPAVIAQVTTSTIKGYVYDEGGDLLSGASVVVKDMRTGKERTYLTNSSGVFLATRLAVGGPYQVVVNNTKSVLVNSVSLGDIYNLQINLQEEMTMEEVVVVGQSATMVDVAAGPSAVFSFEDISKSVAFNRDIIDVYSIDPRVNVDDANGGAAVNCAGKNPRFNSVTLDGVSQNDRFGLNSNGYSTAVGMPFPFDAIQQIAVELAPFDVTYGGFSACSINAVTKTGTNEWSGGAFYEYTSDELRGDSLTVKGEKIGLGGPGFSEGKYGFHIGGPIIADKLFIFGAYEKSDAPVFLARGPAGSGIGEVRDWLSQEDFDRIDAIARDVYGYETGGAPGDGAQETEKYMLRLDWNINDDHTASFIYNYFDGFQDRSADGDDDEFEFAGHFYVKGAESETFTAKLASQWTDAFSTEFFFSNNTMNDSQITVGDPGFADMQININRDTIYLGADDSRQANNLNTESQFFKITGQYLVGNHVITAGFEQESLDIFNIFVQQSRGGEYDFFDDTSNTPNPPHCAALSAQGRFDDSECNMTGIDRFELGRPSRIYYGSAGGTNVATDAAASFTNTQNSVYIQDELYFPSQDLSIVFGLRYDWFQTDDAPNYNAAFSEANGIRNDATVDGIDLLQPRFGFTWGAADDISVRGGFGLYSGGNPNVWISNSYSNDGLTNVQLQLRNFDGSGSILDGSIPLVGNGLPGYAVPQILFDEVGAVTPANGSTSRLALIDPNFKQPAEWKVALGVTWDMPWYDIQVDFDYLHTRTVDAAIYVDLSQSIVGETIIGQPIYAYSNHGRDNFMLTNSSRTAVSNIFSTVLRKEFENGLDLMFGYAFTQAEDVSPMTSSTAGSNFSNVALNDINDPMPATSNYEVPHRFTLRTTWGHYFFKDLETRVSMFAFTKSGQPQSYVMGSGDLEGNGRFGRHLLYVPTGLNDSNVVFADTFDVNAFFAFVEKEGLSSGLTDRNGQYASWSTRFDLRIDQEVPLFGNTKGRVFVKVYNLGNLIDDSWGLVNDAQFFSVQVVNSSVNDAGQYVFERFNDRSINNLLENRSLWTIRMGLEVNF
ncbi:MAG: carboxypeptidase regulatory-like domain-containing protein [Xanthomonadales bacterium]|nr:carboxypeptidase regulatory-like domain-containing protein [Xanthomonadales bacterium]